MHSTLPTHVLALAPDSLASLGELDNDSLSELWSGELDSFASCPNPSHSLDSA